MLGSTARGGSLVLLLGVALGAGVACGGSNDMAFYDDPAAATVGGASGGTINIGAGSGNRPGSGGGASCTPGPDDHGCVGTAFEGENIPLDIYVMFDLSCSMSCSIDKVGCCRLDDPVPEDQWRIQPVRQAMTTFLRDPASAGI